MEAAARAEERALLKMKEKERAKMKDITDIKKDYKKDMLKQGGSSASAASATNGDGVAPPTKGGKIAFVSKKKRKEMEIKEKEERERREKDEKRRREDEERRNKRARNHGGGGNGNNYGNNNNNDTWTHLNNMQVEEIRRHYVGRTEMEIQTDQSRAKEKKRREKRTQFKFQWDASEDTARDADPLYDVSTRKALIKKSLDPLLKTTSNGGGHSTSSARALASETVYSKPLETMTVRDWRIVREDFDIRVRGGRAPNPLRR